MRQKLFDSRPLVSAQIVQRILDGLEIRHILQQVLRIYQILVDIVKILQHHVPPEHKLVQRLRLRVKRTVAVVQLQQQPETVCHVYLIYRVKEVLDGVHGRNRERHTPSLLFHPLSQILTKENHRPPVGEDEAVLLYVRGPEIVRGHLQEEWCHTFLLN